MGVDHVAFSWRSVLWFLDLLAPLDLVPHATLKR